MNRQTLGYVFYGIGIAALLFTVIRTFYRLRKLKKDKGYAREKMPPEENPQGRS